MARLKFPAKKDYGDRANWLTKVNTLYLKFCTCISDKAFYKFFNTNHVSFQ